MINKDATTDRSVLKFMIFEGKTFLRSERFSKEKVVVGKSLEADLILHGRNVFDIHAFFYRKHDQVFVSDGDLGSGVMVNGRFVSSRALSPLDLVFIGPYTLKVELEKALEKACDQTAWPEDELSTEPQSSYFPALHESPPERENDQGDIFTRADRSYQDAFLLTFPQAQDQMPAALEPEPKAEPAVVQNRTFTNFTPQESEAIPLSQPAEEIKSAAEEIKPKEIESKEIEIGDEIRPKATPSSEFEEEYQGDPKEVLRRIIDQISTSPLAEADPPSISQGQDNKGLISSYREGEDDRSFQDTEYQNSEYRAFSISRPRDQEAEIDTVWAGYEVARYPKKSSRITGIIDTVWPEHEEHRPPFDPGRVSEADISTASPHRVSATYPYQVSEEDIFEYSFRREGKGKFFGFFLQSLSSIKSCLFEKGEARFCALLEMIKSRVRYGTEGNMLDTFSSSGSSDKSKRYDKRDKKDNENFLKNNENFKEANESLCWQAEGLKDAAGQKEQTEAAIPLLISNKHDDGDDREEDEESLPAISFSLKEHLMQYQQPQEPFLNPGEMLLEVLKCRGDDVVDMQFLTRKGKYRSLNEFGRFCLAENKDEGKFYFFFTDQFKGKIQFSDNYCIDLERLSLIEELYRKRERIYRCLLPVNSLVSLSDGSYEYYLRLVKLGQSSQQA